MTNPNLVQTIMKIKCIKNALPTDFHLMVGDMVLTFPSAVKKNDPQIAFINENKTPCKLIVNNLTTDLPLLRVIKLNTIEPPLEEGTLWIVSRLFAELHPYRKDLVFPMNFYTDNTTKKRACLSLGSLH